MIIQSVLGLAAVLGLFALLVWAMRCFQARTSAVSHDFSVIQRLYIDSKNSIVEIRYHGQHYLLGLSPAGLTQIRADHALSTQADVANPRPAKKAEQT